ncbi:hypothetical protein Lalb_Chr07g0191131 [Lupinus albus]|uniref:Uncharacterized protein n=1 Tax=Lupinus albus TaxID=3870 RepID=A0A6A4QAI6_LUPAL|nr:hypothetical protein Lalb_Chr07g0191131 [Lupinus albus]
MNSFVPFSWVNCVIYFILYSSPLLVRSFHFKSLSIILCSISLHFVSLHFFQ